MIGLLLNYRDAPRSIRCIQSLLDEGAVAVVVWDNSADGGASARAVGLAYADEPRVDIVVSPTNLGFAAGVNRALAHGRALYPQGWVLLINNDARLLSGGLTALADELNSHPDATLAYPTVDHAGRVLGTAWCHRITGALAWRPHPGYFPYASGCCQLLAVDRLPLPLYDEDFFMYGEDCELGWRLGRKPNAMRHVDQVLVTHDGAASSGLGSAFYESHMVAAHLLLARKLSKNPLDRALLYAARSAMLVMRCLVRTLRYRSSVPLRALGQGARIALSTRRR